MADPNYTASVGGSLSEIKARLKDEGIGGIVKDSLVQNQVALEAWYKKLLEQKGFLTEQEKKQLEDSLTSTKKNLLESETQKAKTIMIVSLVGAIFIAGVIIWYVRKKRKS